MPEPWGWKIEVKIEWKGSFISSWRTLTVKIEV
jgi:hypothetical protein